MKNMNLPNKLTVFRMILIIPFVIVLLGGEAGWFGDNRLVTDCIALGIFIVASLTDLIDGKIARKYNLVTDFGKFMDPLADKLLVCSAMIALVEMGRIPAWVVIIIIGREFIISGFRLVAANNDVILAEFGKSWINSGVEKLLIKERLNEGSIERLQHAIESHKILLSTVSDPDILRRAEDAMDESEKTLDECMKTRGDLDKEFNRKDLELKAAFNRLTEPDTRKLASENNTNSANIVKATTTKQSNNSQTVTIAQPAAVKPSEKQEKGVTCGNCGKENKDGAKFCRYCGTPLVAKSIRFCTECGHKIRPGGKFCPACGTKVED